MFEKSCLASPSRQNIDQETKLKTCWYIPKQNNPNLHLSGHHIGRQGARISEGIVATVAALASSQFLETWQFTLLDFQNIHTLSQMHYASATRGKRCVNLDNTSDRDIAVNSWCLPSTIQSLEKRSGRQACDTQSHLKSGPDNFQVEAAMM